MGKYAAITEARKMADKQVEPLRRAMARRDMITNHRDALLRAVEHLRKELAECKDQDEVREIVEAIVGIESIITSARGKTPISSVLSPSAPEQGGDLGGSGHPPVLNREGP